MWLIVVSCRCPLVKCTGSVGDRFLSRFVYPKFRLLQRLKVEAWTSAENQMKPDLKRFTAAVDDTFLTRLVPNLKPRTSRSSKCSVLTQPCILTVSTKHLDVRFAGKPETRGRLGPPVVVTLPLNGCRVCNEP